jgi:predicted component of type VI protein secretion system
MPDYGLPEYHIHIGYSQVKKAFVFALQEIIERYEPRVQSLMVEQVNCERDDCVLQVTLNAAIASLDALSFDAQLLTGGEVLVRTR